MGPRRTASDVLEAKLLHNFTQERKPAPNDEAEFRDGIAPLVEAGKFGALLI